ncbi:MAG: hypothetical protein JWO09_2435 [Bacteroidetes bacterium]|nr:hypothetical protein [Bacteroidota bacterium]
MAKEVKWTPEAEDTFEKIILYLQDKWTEREVSNFVNASSKIISYISENSLMFRQSRKHNIREAVVTKHNLLLYRVKPRHIELLAFWDTRKNPRKKFRRKK